jgi:protoporphyrinogen/coproporphyrinogen III oxidase
VRLLQKILVAKVHVVGAGISGLTSAFFLRRHGFEVQLYESSSRVGGLIGTQKLKHGIAETGAHAFMNTAFIEELCNELGLNMVPASKLSRQFRFLESNKKICRWPLRFMETLRLLLGIVLVKFRPPRAFETVFNWGARVFGRVAAEKLISKVLQGIYASDATQLSASLVFGRLFRKPLSVRKPKLKGSVAPLGGMQEFTDSLLRRFCESGGTLIQNFEVTESKVKDWIQRDELVVLAVPIWTAAELVRFVDAEVASDLAAVPSLPLEATTIFIDLAKNKPLRPGFGILFDRSESHLSMLGVLQNDQIFAGRTWGEGVSSETWISTGAINPVAEALAKRQSILVSSPAVKPIDQFTAVWPKAIPLFGQKLELAFREDFSTKMGARGIFLVGNYMGEIGVAKIVERSYRLAQKLSSRRNI